MEYHIYKRDLIIHTKDQLQNDRTYYRFTVILLCIFCALKMIFNIVLFMQQNSDRIFRFDKRYK